MEGHQSSMALPRHDNRTPYSGNSSRLKLRKGSSSAGRIPSTPYDRPAAAASRHATARIQAQTLAQAQEVAEGKGGGWIGRGIVNSASRMLTKSATFLFTTLFKRQAPAIAAPPANAAAAELNEESEGMPSLELALPSDEQVISGDCVDARDKDDVCDQVEAADIESILKEKELTREQCERYIKLIRSRFHTEEPPENTYTPRLRTTRDHPVQSLDDRPLESFRKQPTVSRGQQWTPIQVPISGGRESLKKRETVAASPLPIGAKDSSPTRSMSFRGPSILPSIPQKRKTGSETMDLTCFRKSKDQTSLKLSVPSQSTRTAGRILDTLDRKNSFKDLEFRKTSQEEVRSFGKIAENVLTTESASVRKSKGSALPPLSGASSASSGFTFPSTRFGPEPPTPKIPSPAINSRDHIKNGLIPPLPHWSTSAPFSNGSESDIDKMAARVEKASSILESRFGGGPPSLTSSPDKLVSCGFETGSSSRFVTGDDGEVLLDAKEHRTTMTVLCDGPSTTTKSDKFLVGAQSPAPPDGNPPPNSSNGGFSVDAGPEKISKRKKSAKRMR